VVVVKIREATEKTPPSVTYATIGQVQLNNRYSTRSDGKTFIRDGQDKLDVALIPGFQRDVDKLVFCVITRRRMVIITIINNFHTTPCKYPEDR
jgi:hypothetical protein